jgi:hypothetical protein
MPPSPKKFHSTVGGISKWAESELAHMGRIAAVEDPDLQYAYALSTVNGMLHLRNAVYELMNDDAHVQQKPDLQRLYGQVNRAVQHLISEYKVERSTIEGFNTRKVLGNIGNISWPKSKIVNAYGYNFRGAQNVYGYNSAGNPILTKKGGRKNRRHTRKN